MSNHSVAVAQHSINQIYCRTQVAGSAFLREQSFSKWAAFDLTRVAYPRNCSITARWINGSVFGRFPNQDVLYLHRSMFWLKNDQQETYFLDREQLHSPNTALRFLELWSQFHDWYPFCLVHRLHLVSKQNITCRIL